MDDLTKISSSMIDDMPYYIISGSGEGWFFSPDTLQMICVPRGIEIIPLDDFFIDDTQKEDKCNKILVSSPTHVFLIPQKEILEVGYN